jgi:hypothetical protein
MIKIPIVMRKVDPMPIAEWVAESGVDLCSQPVDVVANVMEHFRLPAGS